jgi:hypothetical protein
MMPKIHQVIGESAETVDGLNKAAAGDESGIVGCQESQERQKGHSPRCALVVLWTTSKCINEAQPSQGMKEAFSTGSHAQ